MIIFFYIFNENNILKKVSRINLISFKNWQNICINISVNEN